MNNQIACRAIMMVFFGFFFTPLPVNKIIMWGGNKKKSLRSAACYSLHILFHTTSQLREQMSRINSQWRSVKSNTHGKTGKGRKRKKKDEKDVLVHSVSSRKKQSDQLLFTLLKWGGWGGRRSHSGLVIKESRPSFSLSVIMCLLCKKKKKKKYH